MIFNIWTLSIDDDHCQRDHLRVRLRAGYHEDGLLQASKPMVIGVNGQKHLEVSIMDNINALLFAWQEMHKYERLLRWAWVSRGLLSEQEMRALHPNLSDDEYAAGPSGDTFSNLVPGVPDLVPTLAYQKKIVFPPVCAKIISNRRNSQDGIETPWAMGIPATG